jgi:hypothetical protein
MLCFFENISDWSSDIAKHILAAFIIGAFLYLLQRLRYWIFIYLRFNGKHFVVFAKGDDKKPFQRAICKVSGNKIKYTGHEEGNENNTFLGQFVINPIDLTTGTGYHYHTLYLGFNFPKIIIKDKNTFLVETSYVDAKFQINYQAFRWDKISK